MVTRGWGCILKEPQTKNWGLSFWKIKAPTYVVSPTTSNSDGFRTKIEEYPKRKFFTLQKHDVRRFEGYPWVPLHIPIDRHRLLNLFIQNIPFSNQLSMYNRIGQTQAYDHDNVTTKRYTKIQGHYIYFSCHYISYVAYINI